MHGPAVDDLTDRSSSPRRCQSDDGALASVRVTGSGKDAGILRIDFHGGAWADQLEHISWDDWFDTFDDTGLAFLYQEEKVSGEDSTFFTLISAD